MTLNTLNKFSRVPYVEHYRKVLTVLARHGFDSFMARLKLDGRILLPIHLLLPNPASDHTPAEHLYGVKSLSICRNLR